MLYFPRLEEAVCSVPGTGFFPAFTSCSMKAGIILGSAGRNDSPRSSQNAWKMAPSAFCARSVFAEYAPSAIPYHSRRRCSSEVTCCAGVGASKGSLFGVLARTLWTSALNERLDLPRFRGRVVFQMPSVFLSLDDAPFGFDLSMRGLTPQAPEALRFSNARKNPIALEAL
jgi:hypothetical protein